MTVLVTEATALRDTLPSTGRVVVEQILGTTAPGIQLSIRADGLDVDVALGEVASRTPMRVEHRFSLWCLSKPVVALRSAALHESGVLDLDAPLVAALPDLPVDELLTVRDLLGHDAGLGAPTSVEAYLSTTDKRDELFDASLRAAGRGVPAYSEYSGWRLLGMLLERVTGRPVPEDVSAAAASLGPEGDEFFFELAADELVRLRPDIGMYVVDYPSRMWPLLHDRALSAVQGDRVALGGYASMRFLATLLHRVLDAAAGRAGGGPLVPSGPVVRDLLDRRRGVAREPALGRDVDFAGGFWVNTGGGAFGRDLSEAAFGAYGWLGTSWAVAEPAAGLATAALLNAFPSRPGGVDAVRAELLRAVIEDVAR